MQRPCTPTSHIGSCQENKKIPSAVEGHNGGVGGSWWQAERGGSRKKTNPSVMQIVRGGVLLVGVVVVKG